MARRRAGSELDALRLQAVEIDRKIKEAAAREKARREADDRRRWLLAGQAVLAHLAAEPGSELATAIHRLIDGRARSVADRTLFGLAPIAE